MCLNHRVVPTAPPLIFGDKFPLQVFRNYYLYEVAFFFTAKRSIPLSKKHVCKSLLYPERKQSIAGGFARQLSARKYKWG